LLLLLFWCCVLQLAGAANHAPSNTAYAAAASLAAASSAAACPAAVDPQVDLISEELSGWADRDVLEKLKAIAVQLVEPSKQSLVTSMLGL
jgi:hypothetical protein